MTSLAADITGLLSICHTEQMIAIDRINRHYAGLIAERMRLHQADPTPAPTVQFETVPFGLTPVHSGGPD